MALLQWISDRMRSLGPCLKSRYGRGFVICETSFVHANTFKKYIILQLISILRNKKTSLIFLHLYIDRLSESKTILGWFSSVRYMRLEVFDTANYEQTLAFHCVTLKEREGFIGYSIIGGQSERIAYYIRG